MQFCNFRLELEYVVNSVREYGYPVLLKKAREVKPKLTLLVSPDLEYKLGYRSRQAKINKIGMH